MAKTVLMICSTYYPSNGSGAHRPVKTAKYLPGFGWNSIVVCKKFTPKDLLGTYDLQLAAVPDVCEVVRVSDPFENRVARKLERTLWELVGGAKHDYRFPNLLYRNILRAAERIINTEKVDAIWATSFPGLTHKVADTLSLKYNIPWVADFRDLPDQSYDTKHARYVVNQEIKTCQSAKALIATTEELAEKLRNRHRIPVYTIFNGFDPDEFETPADAIKHDNKFTINHFGILYRFRNPSCLFAAMDHLVRNGDVDAKDIEINFYGADAKLIAELVQDYPWAACVRVPGRLPYPEMLRRQRESQILLMVASPGQGGAIPAKLYGYLASKRPVLCVPGDGGGADRIIAQTKAGASLAEPGDIAEWLNKAYKMWKQKGYVPFCGDETEIQKYSRKTQAGQLAEILNKITVQN